MRRTTISLPDDLALAVKREARRRSSSVSQLAREALAAHLGFSCAARKLPFANLGRSGTVDTAERLEGLMDQDWSP